MIAVIQKIRGLQNDRRGVAAVEFGLAASLLFFMLVGAVDLGLAVRHGQQMEAALRAGLQRALLEGTNLQPFDNYENTVEAIVENAPGLPSGGVASAILECRCVTISGSTVTENVSVNAGTRDEGVATGHCEASYCTGANEVMYHVVKITLVQSHHLVLNWPGLSTPPNFTMTKDVKVPVAF